jgi:hypothetical protein
MSKVTHILVDSFIDNDGRRSVIHFNSVEAVKNYIASNPDILKDTVSTFYKVDEIKPTRTVTIDVSL